jgi:hypothetical protein
MTFTAISDNDYIIETSPATRTVATSPPGEPVYLSAWNGQPTLRDDGNVKVKVEKVEVKLEDAGVSRWSTGMRMTVTIAMPFSTCLRSAVDRLICRRSPRENQKGGFLLCMDTQVPLRLYLEG